MNEHSWTTIEINNVVVVKPRGELDMSNSFHFKSFIRDNYINAGKNNLILDLSEVHYMDSSALGVLLGLQRAARLNGGSMVLCGLHENLLRIFKITSLEGVFRIYPTVEEALKFFLGGN
ncbi:anti-anti-sigma factor [Thermotoga sp. Ku-13t]|uniref:STAS domain-containing protein n=1 Tax=Thermotoga sp. Ku-13t TaxID=1755813 RepID=UPI0013EBA17F|nr:STAS domain-containing protein [Thermotoga sp. Ku-13t]KAF2958909.1 anti-anti-sigma factor [Thermotoga sp. Ku-13t]